MLHMMDAGRLDMILVTQPPKLGPYDDHTIVIGS